MSDIGSLLAEQREEVRIGLRLLRGHEGATRGSWPVPADGGGLAEALELGGERLNDAQWRAANLCRVVRKDDGWQLINDSPSLVCTHNGERVLASRSARLAIGDTLELGLLRFEVEARSEPPTAQGATLPDATASVPVPMHADAEAVEFDLRDLSIVPSGIGEATSLAHAGNPFGVLDIAGAQAQPIGDPLAELLGDVSTASAHVGRHAETSRPRSSTAPADVDHPSANAEHTSRPPTSAHGATDQPTALLFDGLNEEFARVVRDPTQLAGRTDWEGLLVPEGAPAPTLEDLSRQAEPYPLLRDILLSREGIDQVIADFDPLGRSTLMDIDQREDVLDLFAPEIARTARASVPSLTRREHHDMSPDSHMHLGASRPQQNES